jgi:hypothetical protein
LGILGLQANIWQWQLFQGWQGNLVANFGLAQILASNEAAPK